MSQVSIDVDYKFHILELSPTEFNDLSLHFYPGFVERNAFLGEFKSRRKRIKKKKYNEETPIMCNEHSESKDKSTESILSNIPVGSRLRYINTTDCQDMMYHNIMQLLASQLIESQTNIILKFEDVCIDSKVKNCYGAVMAWNVKQEHITKSCVRNIVDSWYITLIIFIVIIYDFCIIFLRNNEYIVYLTLCALTLYMIELCFRIYGYGINNKYIEGYLTRGWLQFIDSFIIIFSLILSVFYDYIPFLYEYIRIVRIIFRIIVVIHSVPKCIRLIVRVNRETYFDEKFDLDLCYIVYPRYLVMSWPSSGLESLYRNPIKNVAKFLNTYHADNYLIFDLCRERSYDDILFSGRVMRSRAMSDHSVCSLSDMFEFAELVHLWCQHNPLHCAVIHCKGGKGRTGLMVCGCLMYDYRDTTVDEALLYFATMRTNINKNGKLQGVETPSQLRYCKYFYQLLHITDVLKTKQKNINDHKQSLSSLFYEMVTSALPHHDISLDDDERIIDDDIRIKIAKHLGYKDLNISGLKQNRCKTSDVNISTLKLDKDPTYVVGGWETSERFRDNTVIAQSLGGQPIISNDSYLFLKQSVVMKLEYVSIGPIPSCESIHWKIEICMKPDFDYFDDMKMYEFCQYKIFENKLKFSAFDNLKNGNSSLCLNGNICLKIYRTQKMIGSIWIHSHFIPANYTQQIDIMTFRKEEIDVMYKDKKHKTSVPHSFCLQIGYRSSRSKLETALI